MGHVSFLEGNPVIHLSFLLGEGSFDGFFGNVGRAMPPEKGEGGDLFVSLAGACEGTVKLS